MPETSSRLKHSLIMPDKQMIVGVQRAPRFSPNSMDRDMAILQGVAQNLSADGYAVKLVAEEAFALSCISDAVAVFSMARSEAALADLERVDRPVLNPPSGLRNSRRSVLTRLFAERGLPMPPTWIVRTDGPLPRTDGPCWLKRSDECAQASGDVVYAANRQELAVAMRRFAGRGLAEAVVCEHVAGDLIKFYGVEGTGFFEYYYPTVEGGFSKFGLERHNGVAHGYSFDVQALTAVAEEAARLLNLPVYGGDCIVDARGRFFLIDFNDWPSFSRCRDRAAEAIARRVIQAIENN